LRYRKTKDGVVVYSLGPDGKDNAGKLRLLEGELSDWPEGLGGLDIGSQLWDVPHRRQAPFPPLRARK
jgi:hypothetical protein